MVAVALEGMELVVIGGADDDGLLGGCGGTGTVTTGGTGQPPELPGGRELWTWLWAWWGSILMASTQSYGSRNKATTTAEFSGTIIGLSS